MKSKNSGTSTSIREVNKIKLNFITSSLQLVLTSAICESFAARLTYKNSKKRSIITDSSSSNGKLDYEISRWKLFE